jgi:hypothetical protein
MYEAWLVISRASGLFSLFIFYFSSFPHSLGEPCWSKTTTEMILAFVQLSGNIIKITKLWLVISHALGLVFTFYFYFSSLPHSPGEPRRSVKDNDGDVGIYVAVWKHSL